LGSDITGKISFVETQGREDLYNVTLSDGSVLRSIQPSGPRLKLGDQVAWGIAADDILAFTNEGARI
jgi:inositol-phosphate transport system ATP-binding protein